MTNLLATLSVLCSKAAASHLMLLM